MEKIILAIDGLNPSPNALDFACYLGRLSKSRVTGVFLENPVSEEKPLVEQGKDVNYTNWSIDTMTEKYQKKNQCGTG